MNPLKTVVIGCGNMGASHARAYHHLQEFELAGLMALGPVRREKLSAELGHCAQFDSLDQAIEKVQPDAAAICTYPDTHFEYAMQCLDANMHIFMEKPLAVTVDQARKIVEKANLKNRKVVVGYILRHHPAWAKFIDIARTLGKPLVMRMNLNQQSSGEQWLTHKNLMQSMSPIVDCGVHYVDVMCQMTRSLPIRVQAIGARLSNEISEAMYNYGQLQVTFADGSVGWYEAGWGPMMSEVAFFVKDVVGPKGAVSIVDPQSSGNKDSAEIDDHTKTNQLIHHFEGRNANGEFAEKDKIIDTADEPDHQELCNREQRYFYKAIRENLDLSAHLDDAINSLRIVLAADRSIREGKSIELE